MVCPASSAFIYVCGALSATANAGGQGGDGF